MSKHKELIEMMSNLEKAEIPYAIASVFSIQGSSSGKVGIKHCSMKRENVLLGISGVGVSKTVLVLQQKNRYQMVIPKLLISIWIVI